MINKVEKGVTMKESINILENEILAKLNSLTDTDEAINIVIEMIGKYFNVDRVYIFENSDDDLSCNNTFEWCNEGITPEKDNLQNLRYLEDLGGEWIDNYDENGLFFCPTVSKLPQKQREVLEPQGIFSMLQCAIKEQGVFKGYIGFDNCQDHLGGWEYDQDAIDALVFSSRLLSLYLLEYRNKMRLMQRNRELEQANKAKTNFLSRMSHELRTPLNAVVGYAALLDDNLVSNVMDIKAKRENIESIQRASLYLLQIIGDALDIQTIEHGKIKLRKFDVNAADYMSDIVEMVRLEAAQKHIDFSYERLTNFSEGYHIDGVRLQQVLLNLLHNAIKFTPEGGVIKMTAGAIDQDSTYTTLQFTVSDTGIGMSKEFMENSMYKSFAQENQDISSPYSGCGMGLTICKEIIKLMHGEIQCESEQGKGTKFTFTIKARHINKKQRRRDRSANKPVIDLSGIRVLICEDNPMNQDMEKKVLVRMNCEVDIAEDGKVGVEMFRNSEKGYYNIVLMDIRMPEMDGLQATKAIRSLEREDAKTTPILAVSANAFSEDVRKSIEAGMNEHLSKPVDARILHQKIREYCKVDNIHS